MNKSLMRLAAFTMLVIWAYALLGNLIPQSASGPKVDVANVERSPEAFVAAGEAIFNSKGKCSTCHTLGEGATKSRCPDLDGVGIRAGTRKPGMSARDYLVESLYLPSDYLVEGYDKIMPQVWKPPVALTPLEIETVIAFLQSQGGKPDVSPIIPPVDIASAQAAPVRVLTGDPLLGKVIFEEELQCIRCHKVGEQGGQGGVGSDLTEIGALNTIDYIEESILYPNATIVTGYGYTTLNLKNGEQLRGTVIKEDEKTITLKLDEVLDDWGWDEEESTEGEFSNERIVAKEDLAEVPVIVSKMPKYDEVITVKQFQDLLAFLVSLK